MYIVGAIGVRGGWQRDGKIDAAELDAIIAIVSGQQPKNELEAMIVSQMAVTRAHHCVAVSGVERIR